MAAALIPRNTPPFTWAGLDGAYERSGVRRRRAGPTPIPCLARVYVGSRLARLRRQRRVRQEPGQKWNAAPCTGSSCHPGCTVFFGDRPELVPGRMRLRPHTTDSRATCR